MIPTDQESLDPLLVLVLVLVLCDLRYPSSLDWTNPRELLFAQPTRTNYYYCTVLGVRAWIESLVYWHRH